MNNIRPTNDDTESLIEKEGADNIKLGQWFWVTSEEYNDELDNWKEHEWLGCVVNIGSNHIELKSPPYGNGHKVRRVLFKEIHEHLRPEAIPDKIIEDKVNHYQAEIKKYLNEIKNLTSRLGVSNAIKIEGKSNTNNSIMVLSSQSNITAYKNDLIKAKDKDIPELNEKVDIASRKLKKWMAAEILPFEASKRQLEGSMDGIEDRIFNVSLYAGISEDVKQCAEGKNADYEEKLHVMQRRLYMDEECLLDYQHGGMEFEDIDMFDKWLIKQENLERILPFPRCLVAMRVRRNRKDRDSGPRLLSSIIKIQLEDADKHTFLYVRNGENVYRIDTELDFGEMIFPDQTMFNPDEPKMVKMFCDRVDRMMSVNEYEDRLSEYNEAKSNYDTWAESNPEEHWMHNPVRVPHFHPNEWKRFNEDNVYYDECVDVIGKSVKQYNRIALIIQGLFDRSNLLSPHAPVTSWTAEGFAQAINLIYDSNNVLHHREAPNFEAYRQGCNAQIDIESVVIGQHDYWLKKEAVKECKRLDNDYRMSNYDYRPTRFQPEGNPGPGEVSYFDRWQPKARKAVFSWNRDRLSDPYDYIRTTVTVPEKHLFNISAYKPGDFKQFFQDPRTRADYLKWAPMLITAEEYHAGNIEPSEPVK